MDTDKIKAKIQALLAKAKGTDNEHEAEAFLAKAQELLEQYQIDIGDLISDEDPVIVDDGFIYADSGHVWRRHVYRYVAMLYGCKSIKHAEMMDNGKGRRVPGTRQTLVGRESAIVTTKLMYPYIVDQVRAQAKRIAPLTGMSEQGQAKRVASALIERIGRMLAERETVKPKTEAAARNALVTVEVVQAKFDELFSNVVAGKMKASKTDELSRSAASKIGLYRQTGHEKQARLS